MTLASAGLTDGGCTFTVVATDGAVTGFGGAGRWESSAWRGAWEIVWRGGESAAAPVAAAAALDWRPGRRVGVGAVVVSTTGRLPTRLASTHELAGRDGGDGWAVRGAWSATPGVRFLGLYADRRRRRSSPGRERRRLLELQVRCRPAAGLEARVRFRGSASEAPVWDPDWPWEAPQAGPSAHRQSVSLDVVRTAAGLVVRTGLRTLSLSGPGTSGRRSLLGLEVRRTDAGVAWRAGWYEAWGDPVDLVSAISPLPGSLAPRHWGAWRGEVWAGFSRAGRRGMAAIACHLRRPRVAGNAVPEVRGEVRLRW